MFRKQSWVVAVAALALSGSTAWADDDDKKSATADDRDDRLEDKVETRLKTDDKLDHINIDVDKGVVTMSVQVEHTPGGFGDTREPHAGDTREISSRAMHISVRLPSGPPYFSGTQSCIRPMSP